MSDGNAVNLLIRFETIVCCKCGMAFAVDANIRSRWVENGGSFYCPSGHPQHYTETDVQRLQKKLAKAERDTQFQRDQAEMERKRRASAEHRERAQKAAKTRLRNRIKNGVCPCCTRSFENLQKHIATKHPEFQPNETE